MWIVAVVWTLDISVVIVAVGQMQEQFDGVRHCHPLDGGSCVGFRAADAHQHSPITDVGVDDRAAARQIAEHVLAQGHRRLGIAMFTHPGQVPEGRVTAPVEPRNASLRYAGYRDAIEQARLDPDEVPIFAAETSVAGSRRVANWLLDTPDRPTAIMAMSDQLALGILEVARERQLEVPGDLAVAGFDGIPAADTTGLTTIHQPQEQKGATAVEILLSGARPQEPSVLPTKLVVRSSTAGSPAHER